MNNIRDARDIFRTAGAIVTSGAHAVRIYVAGAMQMTTQTQGVSLPMRAKRCVGHVASATLLVGAVMAVTVGAPAVANAQWSTAYEQFYLPGKFNWTFRDKYPAADRLFAAFDYGHAILYERLYSDPHAPTSDLEQTEYDFITKKLLVSPPRLPLEEAAIEITYAKMAPEAKIMFDWAHLLHRQIYDVLASEDMSQADKDAKIAELVVYYKTRPDLAFSSVPKNMELMEGQPYSLAFRQSYPKFNGLIWGYHWLQVGLYEPLMAGISQEERQAGVAAAVSRFRQMLENAPEHMPRVMPMTAAIAPTFAKRYQEAAIIFDNLHAMHDVVSDILTNDKVPHNQKRAAILEAASRYRDASSFTMPVAEWATMGEMMGIANMGGPAVGILPGWPTPTLARGASMLNAMKGMSGMAGMEHEATGASAPKPGMPGMKMSDSSAAAHGGMPNIPGRKMGDSSASSHGAMPNMRGMAGMNMSAHDSSMMRLHEQMMRDPVIRQRMMADTAMRRMMSEMEKDSAAMHSMKGMPGMAEMEAKGGHDMKGMKGMKGMKDMKEMPGMSNDARSSTATKQNNAKRAAARKPLKKEAVKTPARSKSVTTPTKRDTTPRMDMKNMKNMKGMKGMPGMKP